MNGKTDFELLSDFAEQRREAPFGELVKRYIDLVHSVALRLVVDPHLAEDVSQAVFVALAERSQGVARKLKHGMPLSGWLHLTARNVAAKCVRTESRRRAREQAVAAMEIQFSSNASDPWDEMAPHLDHALAELPHPDRDALLLRFFEGRTAREMGQRLGISEEAAQKRVARALDRLRERFALRGVTVSMTTMTAAIAAHAVHSAPAALASGITGVIVGSGIVAATPLGLTGFAQLTSTLAMTKSQTAVLIAVLALAAVPLGLQQVQLAELRGELSEQRSPAAEFDTLPSSMGPREPEAAEIERLRRQAQNLRAELASRSAQEKTSGAERPSGPTLLLPGRAVATSELVFAGSATPEATLQSLLAATRDGEIEGFLALSLKPPHEEDRQMLATEEGREKWVEALQSSMQPIQSVEVLGRREISETRLQLVVRESRTNTVVTNSLSFGRTSRGWKRIP